MTAESQPIESAPTLKEPGRMRSTIEFPYFDLASAIEVAQAVKQVGGFSSCDVKSLAVKLDMAPDGGGFRTRLMSAKTLGLIEYERGQVELTDLGLRVVDPQTERAARLESFMYVPLYKALFDKLNGQALPPPAAVERMAEQLGVAPKQKDKARQAFMRSARTAGLFEISSERLSLPPNAGSSNAGADAGKSNRSGDGGGGDGSNGGGDEPPAGRLRFEVPIPGKPSAVVMVPDDLDADDWEMLNTMMTTYISRWKKFPKKAASASDASSGGTP